jgi:hypothetical protein
MKFEVKKGYLDVSDLSIFSIVNKLDRLPIGRPLGWTEMNPDSLNQVTGK